MKRPIVSGDYPATGEDKKMKKIKTEEEVLVAEGTESVLLDENLMYEVLKHVDARTLGSAACVSKQWHKTAQDERLWELICTEQWANIGCGKQQLRSVVLALGGFRRSTLSGLWSLASGQAFLIVNDGLALSPTAADSGRSGEDWRGSQNSLGKGRGSSLAVSPLHSLLREDEFQ